MIHRQMVVEHVAPWLASGVSGLYVLARARRLSLARPRRVPLSSFLLGQPDLMLALCGSPIIWHLSRPARRALRRHARLLAPPPDATAPGPIHQLRQVFTALLIGTGLLVRKASQGKTADLLAVSLRLHRIVRDGADALARVDGLRLGELLDADVLAPAPRVERNGYHA